MGDSSMEADEAVAVMAAPVTWLPGAGAIWLIVWAEQPEMGAPVGEGSAGADHRRPQQAA